MTGAAPASWLGRTVGPYQILRAIGAGGMGEVYEAAHTRLAGKRYAIKVLLPRLVSPGMLARFKREAEILARLRHPGIVAVHDFATAGDGAVYLVMDLLEGINLATRLARGLPDLGEVRRIVGEIAGALDAAHAAGVVHRDLKPANVFLCNPAARVVVLDFGVAKDLTAADKLTASGDYFGTPAYMSPEQASGRSDAVDHRTDVFALGAIAWEMLVGSPAFAGDSLPAILSAITSGPRPRLQQRRPDLPAAVGAVIDRALAIDPAERIASARELAAELDAALSIPGPTLPPPVATEPTPPPAPERDRSTPLHVDDDVQFTVYRPRLAAPEIWHPLLAFAHLSDRPIDAGPDEPDPLEEIERQAARILGERAGDYRDVTQDSRQAVPKEGELTFVPEVPGVAFNPPSRSFLWLESVHREEFRFKAPARLAGSTARGRLSVRLGRIILAEVALAIRVGDAAAAVDIAATEPTHARAFRKIFASFVPEDSAVVTELERYARSLGDQFLGDGLRLRGAGAAGELRQLIGQADVFQLFWSSRSMRSPAIRAEWEYALSLGRPGFVRPTYWEEPLPADPAAQLPPPELVRLGFEKVLWTGPTSDTVPRPPASPPPSAAAPGFAPTLAGGAPMGAPPPPPVSQPTPVSAEPHAAEPPAGGSRLLWWIAAAVVLAAIAVAIYLLAG